MVIQKSFLFGNFLTTYAIKLNNSYRVKNRETKSAL